MGSVCRRAGGPEATSCRNIPKARSGSINERLRRGHDSAKGGGVGGGLFRVDDGSRGLLGQRLAPCGGPGRLVTAGANPAARGHDF